MEKIILLIGRHWEAHGFPNGRVRAGPKGPCFSCGRLMNAGCLAAQRCVFPNVGLSHIIRPE
jgi:hypothetical protein